jgi:hypothetical protein
MKKILFILAAIALVAASVGSGALSAAKMYDRSAAGYVRMDTHNAYIKFRPYPSGDGVYVTSDSMGRVKFKFGASGNGGTGLNPDSENWFMPLFTVINQGTKDLELWYTSNKPNRCKLFWDSDQYQINGIDGFVPTSPPGLLIKPVPGGSWTLGLYMDARGYGVGSTLHCDFTFYAD